MSSEGSVSTTSSGIRQFGLYRTIDARTEEFLRLSRKRQIRQGCACAAISTAITVTVVISIALIYEYTIFNESNSKTSLKPNWLSLINQSADIPFEAKLNKAKINLDPIYVQFLPLILKTMKKNKYFNKLLEEDSSQTPVYERIGNQEEKYTTNIFSDTRNWMRVPTSRLYAIEYKTSPIVYFKNPTRNIDHFRKIRRIRDYQRIMNYIDKMISEKVTYGSTIPMFKNTHSFHRKIPISHTTPMTKVVEHVIKKTQPKNPKYSNQVLSTDIKMNCRCPKQMSELLSKLIKSLQKLIPDFVSSDQKTTVPCDESRLKRIGPIKNTLDQTISKIPLETSTQNYRSYHKLNKISTDFHIKNLFTSTQNIPTPDSETESLEIFKIQSMYQPTTNQPILKTNTVSKMLYSLKPVPSKLNYSPSSVITFLKPSLHQNTVQDKKTKEFTTTIDQFIEATNPNYDLQESTTKPMETITSTTKVVPILTTVKDFILKKKNCKITKSLITLPTYNGDLYEDYNVDTTPDIVNSFKVLDANSIELVKNNLLATGNERKNMKGVNHFKNNDDLTNHEVDYTSDQQYATKTINILKKMGTLAYTTTDSSYDTNWKFTNSSIDTYLEEKIDNLNIEANSSQKLNQIKQEQQLKIEDITLEEEVDKAFTEDMIPEYNIKNLENAINKLNDSDKRNKTLSKDDTDLYLELTDNEDLKDKDGKMSRSMIPESRSSYLEIQRNDWKHDENQDYDNNINNYFFE